MKKLFLHMPTNATEHVAASFNEIVATLPQSSGAMAPWARDSLDMQGLSYLGECDDWHIALIDDERCEELLELAKTASKLAQKHGNEAFLTSAYAAVLGLDDVLISFDDNKAGMRLLLQSKMNPLVLDFEQLAYSQRLLRGGRQKEPVARAVLTGIEDGELVFDATAGLGRESMILAHAGARVVSFERQLPIWIILSDALARARSSRFFPFTLPTLQKRGTIADYEGQEQPQVIYYDPMFPERDKSAQVKKDMYLFQQVIGEDQDTLEFLKLALDKAAKRVVVKRPSIAPPLEVDGKQRDYFVDGGQCRFDCYQC